MKIAFISQYAGIIDGGVERHTHRIAKELAKKNDVTIFTANEYEGRKFYDKTIDKVKYVRLHVSINLSYRLKVWPALYKELTKGFEVIQGFGHGHLYFSNVMKAAKNTNAKLFYTIYGPADKESDYNLIEKIILKIIGLNNDKKIKECDKIFLRNPDYAKEWLNSLGVPNKKIMIDIGAIEKEYLTTKKKAKEKENIILYNGRISPQKGIQFLIDSVDKIAKENEKIQLIITGPDQEGYENQMKEKVKKLGIEKNVKFLGEVSEQKLIGLFDEATIFAMPSSYEGLGQSLIKAMARGKACIAMNTGAIPWVLGNGKYGILINQKEELAEIIIKLLKDKKKRQILGKRAKQRAKIFSYEKSLKNLIKEYE